MTTKTAKRVRLPRFSLRLVREGSTLVEWDTAVTGPAQAAKAIAPAIEDLDREAFVALCMDTKGKPIGLNVVSVGTLNAALVHPREVFKAAILVNAQGLIVAHNHPSGDPTPSNEDVALSRRLIEAGKILGIPVHDSLVIGAEGRFVSLHDRGLL